MTPFQALQLLSCGALLVAAAPSAWAEGTFEIPAGAHFNNDKLAKFAATMEKVCVDTVEQGFMTKDLALLVGPDQKWLTTEGFLDKVDENLKKAMG